MPANYEVTDPQQKADLQAVGSRMCEGNTWHLIHGTHSRRVRHGLILKDLGKPFRPLQNQVRAFRNALEAHVEKRYGRITLSDASIIDLATRCQMMVLLADQSIRDCTAATSDQRFTWMEKALRAVVRRDLCIERLDLDGEGERRRGGLDWSRMGEDA